MAIGTQAALDHFMAHSSQVLPALLPGTRGRKRSGRLDDWIVGPMF